MGIQALSLLEAQRLCKIALTLLAEIAEMGLMGPCMAFSAGSVYVCHAAEGVSSGQRKSQRGLMNGCCKVFGLERKVADAKSLACLGLS